MSPIDLRSRRDTSKDVQHAAAHNENIGRSCAGFRPPLRPSAGGIIVANAIIQAGLGTTAIDHDDVVAKPGQSLGDVVEGYLTSANLPCVNAGGSKGEVRAAKGPDSHGRGLVRMVE